MKLNTFLISSLALVAAGAGCGKKEKTAVAPKAGSSVAAAADPAAGSGAATKNVPPPQPLGTSAGAVASTHIIVKDVGLATPESVMYVAADDDYLVSNINGTPFAVDNNGFISKLSPDGKVIELKWIEGGKGTTKLDAPKGMAISGDTLWIADITNVRKFDAKTGKPTGSIPIKGSVFLNDVASDNAGGIYVSDTSLTPDFKTSGHDAVYHVDKDGKVKPLIKNKDLGGPNGVTLDADGTVWVVTFASGELYPVDAKGKKGTAVKLPKGQLDGLIDLGGGEVLVSSWEGKAVYRGKADGSSKWDTVASDVAAPADIGWDSKRKLLLIPQFMDNAVQIIDLASLGIE